MSEIPYQWKGAQVTVHLQGKLEATGWGDSLSELQSGWSARTEEVNGSQAKDVHRGLVGLHVLPYVLKDILPGGRS